MTPDFWSGWLFGFAVGFPLGYVFDRWILRATVDWYVGVWRRRAW